MNQVQQASPIDISPATMEGDDLSTEYQANRNTLASRSAGADLLGRYSGPEQAAAVREPTNWPAAEASPATGESGALATIGAAGSDIGRGLIEAPRSVAAGVRGAAEEVKETLLWLSSWAKDIPGPGVVWSDEEGIQLMGPAAWREWKDQNPDQVGTLPELPGIRDPETVTGGLVKGVSQFLTGFAAAGATAPLKALQPTGTAGKVGKAMLQGAMADFAAFDPHEERLGNLVEQFPALQNPVTGFLAAEPDDSEAEGRFKNTLEGFGLGALTEGLFRATKAVRTAQIAKRQAAGAPGMVDDIRPEVEPDAFKLLGDSEDAALFKAVDGSSGTAEGGPAGTLRAGDPGQVDPADLAVAPENPEMFINFARIDSDEDVKTVMQTMADSFKPDIDEARRGAKMSFRQMELSAEQVDAFQALQSRRVGEPLNAEQSVAARQLWAASSDRLTAAAKEAAANPSESNLFAFRKMVAVHTSIQSEVIAARTETARALASWRIPAGGNAERFAAIDDAIQASGGSDLSREMAGRIAALADNGMINEMDAFVQKSTWVKSRDAMLEAWVAGLLSGPKTHMVNMMSNTSVIFQQMAERATAARIAQALGDDGSVQLGEATAQFFGMMQGMKDAIRYSAKSFKTGESGYGLGKVDIPNQGAISSEAFNIASDTWVGRTVDVMGTAARLPFRSLTAADEFFKTIGYRMELNALALRQANGEVNSGAIPADQLKARIVEILEAPPESLRMSAVDQATYQTFTNTPGQLAQNISKTVNQYPALRVILPFVRTPANIMSYTFQRTPLAPLMSGVRADIAAGGSRRDLAMARMATGTTIMMVTADSAMNGDITGNGPSNFAERQALMRTGWQPYSVKVDGRYYAYNRMDPIGMTMGLSADMVEILANDDYGSDKEKTMEEAAVALSMSIANNVMSKTYLSGVSDFFEAMADPDRRAQGFFQRLGGSVVPTGVAEVARFKDPYMREANNMLDAIRRRTPGLSDMLPPRRDLWGEPISFQSGLGAGFDAMSPIYSRAEKPSPIDEEILRLDASVTMPPKKTSFNGVSIDLSDHPEAWSRYVELAGNELKHPAWNQGAKDMLNDLVSGRHTLSPVYQMYSDGPDGGKADYIKKTLNDYREMARRQLLDEFPELRSEYEDKDLRRREIKMPVMNN
tara:strand:+ start:1846 stop:5310 length:3465 start_codon:yes stop_codon:yes gene_type:complete